jgi:hypothetical protein
MPHRAVHAAVGHARKETSIIRTLARETSKERSVLGCDRRGLETAEGGLFVLEHLKDGV